MSAGRTGGTPDRPGPPAERAAMPGGAWRIEPMSPDDAEAVAGVEAATGMAAWGAEYYRRTAAEPDSFMNLVVVRDEPGERKPVAYCACRRIVDEVHVYKFAVHPDVQGNGLGRRLLEELLSRCREEGAAQVSLEVRPSNARAIGLYTRFGFRVVGRRAGYYPDTGEDCLDMLLKLNC